MEKGSSSHESSISEGCRIKELKALVKDLQARLRLATTRAYILCQELANCRHDLRHSREQHGIASGVSSRGWLNQRPMDPPIPSEEKIIETLPSPPHN